MLKKIVALIKALFKIPIVIKGHKNLKDYRKKYHKAWEKKNKDYYYYYQAYYRDRNREKINKKARERYHRKKNVVWGYATIKEDK